MFHSIRTSRKSVALLASATALAAALSASSAFAEDGHGGHGGGRGSDDAVRTTVTQNGTPVVVRHDDNDINDDRGVDLVDIDAAPAANQAQVNDDAFDDND
jgi:hypothetical protein